MGFLLEPVNVALPTAHSLKGVRVTWDGIDPSVVTIGAFAKDLCVTADIAMFSLLLFRENRDVLAQLAPQTQPFFAKRGKEVAERLKATSLVDVLLRQALGPEDGSFPVHAFVSQMLVAAELKMPFSDFKIDFSQLGSVVISVGSDKATWDQCRASKSKISMRNRAEVVAYRDAATALLPDLKTLEEAVAAAETVATAHQKGVGKTGLNAFGALTVVYEMTKVYSQQDGNAERIMAKSRRLLEVVGQQIEKDLKSALKTQVDALEKLYGDEAFCNKLYDYFEAWDPTHVYYFDAAVKRGQESKDLNEFDKRLQVAMEHAARYLSLKDAHVERALAQLAAAAEAIWDEVVEGPGLLKSDTARKSDARELLKKMFEKHEPGWLTVWAVWSGRVSIVMGNMEGPPTIVSLMLGWYSSKPRFAELLATNDLRLIPRIQKFIVMLGVDPVERKAVLELMANKDTTAQDLGRRIFNNGSWRSPAMFHLFRLLTLVTMLDHLSSLSDAFANGKINDFDKEALKLLLPLAQDALGFALIGFTEFYSEQMGAHLRTHGTQRLRELAAEVDRLETGTVQAKLVPYAHAGLALVTLVLAYWSYNDQPKTATAVEQFVAAATVGAAFISLLGVAGGALGPAGIIIGAMVTALALGYEKWFKPTMTSAMQGAGDVLLNDPYLKSKGRTSVDRRSVFVVFVEDVSLQQFLEETVDELVNFDWKDKLNPKHMVDYARSGLPPARIAELYKIDESVVRAKLRAARSQTRTHKLGRVKTEVALVQPGSFAVEFFVGEVNDMKLAVSHNDREQLPNNMWLETTFAVPNEFLADDDQTPATTYSPSTGVVMLHTRSSTNTGRVYAGSMRLNKLPPGGTVQFVAFVPDDKFATGPTGDSSALVLRELVFNVKAP